MGWLRRPMESYRGRHIGCAPGTHATLERMIVECVPHRRGVLDIGAHSGALLLRLRDAGFDGLVGADLDETRFSVDGAEFVRVDLNDDFAKAFDRRFKLITATDVVEHLDSPRHFLVQARELLDADGWLALSVPNVAFWEGRVKFALTGELWGFGARNYRSQRHISPMTFEQATLMMSELGFELVAAGSGGSCATALRTALTFPAWLAFRSLGGPSALGECALFLARKAEPDPELKRPLHYRNRWRGIPDRIGIDAEH